MTHLQAGFVTVEVGVVAGVAIVWLLSHFVRR
jgi:hypothetical protein